MLCACVAGEEKQILVEHDDGIRPDISTAALSKLKAVFKKDGTTTAGNSSQVSNPRSLKPYHFLYIAFVSAHFAVTLDLLSCKLHGK